MSASTSRSSENLYQQYTRRTLTVSGLVKIFLGVFGAFFVSALVWSYTEFTLDAYEKANRRYKFGETQKGDKILKDLLNKNPMDRKAWLTLAKGRAFVPRTGRPGEEGVVGDRQFLEYLDSSGAFAPGVLRAWHYASLGGNALAKEIITTRIKNAAPEKVFLYQTLGGDINFANYDFASALEYYRNALKVADKLKTLKKEEVERVRGQYLNCLYGLNNNQELTQTLENPLYYQAASDRIIYQTLLYREKYLEAGPYLWRFEVMGYTLAPFFAAIFCGLGWLAFCLRMGGAWEKPRRRQLTLALPAMLLGALSALFCLLIVVIEDSSAGFAFEEFSRQGFSYNLLYCLFGIALREEVCKLLFLLPLLPFLARKVTEEVDETKIKVDALIIASLVGLGFAAEENINYFFSPNPALVGRFLSANFLHLSMTGFAGYHLVLAIRKGGDAWHGFAEAFITVTLCHGLYDFLLIEKSLEELSFLAFTVLIWLAMKYFSLLRELFSRPLRWHISLSSVFVINLAAVIGIGFLFLSMKVGIPWALLYMLEAILGIVFISIMYFREIDEEIQYR